MNQEQRKFLVDRVIKTFDKQKTELQSSIPVRPSLNNYLVAAFLDGSIQFNDINKLKEKIRQQVISFGPDDKLVNSESSFRNSTVKERCSIAPEDLFIVPEAYRVALAEYLEKRSDIEHKIAVLEAQKDTIVLKINIGSNQVLDKLIAQADNLADLSIINAQLLLAQ